MKSTALIPHPDVDLSATRHKDLTEELIWDSGKTIAAKRGRSLFGRADIEWCKELEDIGFIAEVDDPPWNHILILGWPEDRSEQLAMAEKLVRKCKGVRFTP